MSNETSDCRRGASSRLLAVMLLGILAGCEGGPVPVVGAAKSGIEIRVLSNRADLVSGGDALVEILGVSGGFSADVDGRDVGAAFAQRADGRVVGLVQGLLTGRNLLTVRGGASQSRITITNHPSGGPVFAGEQVQPWVCTTEANGLGAPTDAQCGASAVYHFYYRPVGVPEFRPYDPANPPDDVAMTTTDEGRTVPYIVRQETGAQDRGIYRIAVLFDPAQDWQPWAPQGAWNRKLHYFFDGGCGVLHRQFNAPNVLDAFVLGDLPLSRGFMVASSSLNVLGASCNTWTSAEAVMMLKEHIVERYGELRYTTASGASGGAIGQHLVANNYPGLLQGILPMASYPDLWSGPSAEVADCHLMLEYFRDAAPGLWSSAEEKTAVSGFADLVVCNMWEAWFFSPWFAGSGECGLDPARAYDAASNPHGCRGTVQDFNVAVLGRRSSQNWDDSPSADTRSAEAQAGGFARLPYDNTGVQYGLQALRDGAIGAEQFVDLNERIGTVDIDGRRMAGRRRADAAAEVLYGAGGVNDGSQLDQVAIIDLRPTLNVDIHTDVHSYSMRARLDRANGHHANQVIWTSTFDDFWGLAGDAFLALDRWLAAIEADTQPAALEEKVVRNRPVDVLDTCFIEGRAETDAEACRAQYPYYASPRLVAGMPLTNDVLSCHLKPLHPADYPNTDFSDEQWARLQAVFPDGVCDYSVPGIGQMPSEPWKTFLLEPGGRAMPSAPASRGV